MTPFIAQAQFYAAYHQKPMTRYTHFAGVPLIIFSLMIFLGFIKIIMPTVFSTDVAFLTTIAALIYYFRLNWRLALPLTPMLLLLLWLAGYFSEVGPTKVGVWAFLISFILGWGLQFYGHFIEGKQPAFMVNLKQAFIAPLFLMAELFFLLGYMQPLKQQIYGTDVINQPDNPSAL